MNRLLNELWEADEPEGGVLQFLAALGVFVLIVVVPFLYIWLLGPAPR